MLLAIAVAAPPILAVGMPWLFLRIRFFRRKLTVVALARTNAGVQLLALRALANRPLRKLTEISLDPVGAWRHDDPMAVRGLPPSSCGRRESVRRGTGEAPAPSSAVRT